MRTSNSISKRYEYFYIPKDRFGWKPRSWKQVFTWFEKGIMVLGKGYTFRKRSVDFAPLAWRNYYWVRNKYSTPITYKPIWNQIEYLRDKRSGYINLKLKEKWKNWKARENFRKWSYLAYKHNPYKIVRSLGKYLILQQKYRDLKFSAQGRVIRNKLRLQAYINFYKTNKGYLGVMPDRKLRKPDYRFKVRAKKSWFYPRKLNFYKTKPFFSKKNMQAIRVRWSVLDDFFKKKIEKNFWYYRFNFNFNSKVAENYYIFQNALSKIYYKKKIKKPQI